VSNMSNKKKARELYESGYGSLAKVAESLGENKNTVESWKKRDKKDNNEWVKMSAKNKKTSARKDEEGRTQKVGASKEEKIKKNKLKEIEGKLTEKQKLFAYYYIKSFNATQSAINAGYSKETAGIIGHENLKKPNIKALILELREGFNEELHLDANRILNRHAKIAMSDIKDFVEYGVKEYTYIDQVEDREGKKVPITKTSERFEMNFKDSELIDGTIVKKIKMGKFGLEFELEDRGKSLEFLTKYMGLVVEEKPNEGPLSKTNTSNVKSLLSKVKGVKK